MNDIRYSMHQEKSITDVAAIAKRVRVSERLTRKWLNASIVELSDVGVLVRADIIDHDKSEDLEELQYVSDWLWTSRDLTQQDMHDYLRHIEWKEQLAAAGQDVPENCRPEWAGHMSDLDMFELLNDALIRADHDIEALDRRIKLLGSEQNCPAVERCLNMVQLGTAEDVSTA